MTRGELADRNAGQNRQPRLRMHHLAGALVEHDLGARRARLVADLREERPELIVLVLRPALERMVVALGAGEADAQEELRDVLGRGRGVAHDAHIVGGGILVGVAGGGDQFAHELIVRLVFGDGGADPVAELAHARHRPRNLLLESSRSDHLFVQRSLKSSEASRLSVRLLALLRRGRLVFEESAGGFGRGQQAGQVEVDAAKEGRVVAEAGGLRPAPSAVSCPPVGRYSCFPARAAHLYPVRSPSTVMLLAA